VWAGGGGKGEGIKKLTDSPGSGSSFPSSADFSRASKSSASDFTPSNALSISIEPQASAAYKDTHILILMYYHLKNNTHKKDYSHNFPPRQFLKLKEFLKF
jgi:hypothetical protein